MGDALCKQFASAWSRSTRWVAALHRVGERRRHAVQFTRVLHADLTLKP